MRKLRAIMGFAFLVSLAFLVGIVWHYVPSSLWILKMRLRHEPWMIPALIVLNALVLGAALIFVSSYSRARTVKPGTICFVPGSLVARFAMLHKFENIGICGTYWLNSFWFAAIPSVILIAIFLVYVFTDLAKTLFQFVVENPLEAGMIALALTVIIGLLKFWYNRMPDGPKILFIVVALAVAVGVIGFFIFQFVTTMGLIISLLALGSMLLAGWLCYLAFKYWGWLAETLPARIIRDLKKGTCLRVILCRSEDEGED